MFTSTVSSPSPKVPCIPVTLTLASPVICAILPAVIVKSCSVTTTVTFPSALTEKVPSVKLAWEPETCTLAFPVEVSSPNDIVIWEPLTLTGVFTAAVIDPILADNWMPVTLIFAFPVTVEAPTLPVSWEPVTATVLLVPPNEAIGDCERAVIPNTAYLAVVGVLLVPTMVWPIAK